jgi:hypothetical protein
VKVTFILGPFLETSRLAHAVKLADRQVSRPHLVLTHPTVDKVSQGLAAQSEETILGLHLIITLPADTNLADWPFQGRATVITLTPPTTDPHVV